MSTPAGWYPDPTGRHQNRWFDGDDWTDSIADGQTVGTDPVKGGPPATDAGATQVVPQQQPIAPTQPAAATPPPGAPGAPVAGAVGGAPPPGAPIADYTSPSGSSAGGGKGKTGLIIGVVVVLIAVVVGVVLVSGGGDDGGTDEASSTAPADDEDQSDEPEEDDDPSASDLFDDMADEANEDEGDSGDEGDDDVFGTDEEPADEPEDTTAGGEYPPEVIDTFVSNCVGGGGTEALCTCTIEALERDVAYDDFIALAEEYAQTGEAPQVLIDAATECGAPGG